MIFVLLPALSSFYYKSQKIKNRRWYPLLTEGIPQAFFENDLQFHRRSKGALGSVADGSAACGITNERATNALLLQLFL